MEYTYANVIDLRPGNILYDDVFAKTNYPIMKKDTQITNEKLQVLHAFNIKKVKIKDIVIKRNELDEDTEQIVDTDEIISAASIIKSDFSKIYQEAVQNFKKEFMNWKSGARPDIAKVRTIIIPLLEASIDNRRIVSRLKDFADLNDYTFHHSIAVGIIAAAISKQMSFPKGQVLQIGLAGVLADCGMSKIDSSIIERAAFLTKEEYNEVKKHTIYSFQMVKDSPLLRQEMKLAILQHHERLDGSGYPRGDRMEQVSIISQIIAVADVFHAMTSERIYRRKESVFKVAEMINEEEFGKFNIKVVDALHDLVCNLTIGTKVQLSNGEEGEVIFTHRDSRLRPMIKIKDNDKIIDLASTRQLYVEKVL